MRRSRTYPLWIDEAGDMDPRYRHLSYVLFRADGEDTMILAARCPEEERFAVGRQITDALHLDEEALQFLLVQQTDRLLLIHTDLGVGVLDKRYARYGGVGVYWHIHGDAESLGRLINHGVLGDAENGGYAVSRSVAALKSRVRAQDMPVYEVLTEAWNLIMTPSPSAWATEDGNGCIYGEELARMTEKMADFVGVRAIRDGEDPPVGRARCRRPIWLEICFLYLLTEARSLSVDGNLYYVLGGLCGVEGEGLSIQFRYLMDDPDRFAERLDPVHRYLRRVGELHGMDFYVEILRPKRGGRQRGLLPEMRFVLDWLRDPTVLESSDLKAETEFGDTDPDTALRQNRYSGGSN